MSKENEGLSRQQVEDFERRLTLNCEQDRPSLVPTRYELLTLAEGCLALKAENERLRKEVESLRTRSREARDMNRTSAQVYQDDVKEIMEALGMATHARPRSPHRVAQEEVIPWASSLRDRNRVLEKFVRKLSRESSEIVLRTGPQYRHPSTREADND